MIKANELRIGNYVDCTKKRHNEKVILVESVTFDKINVNFREYDLSDLLPIPLTEKILLKAGFEKSENTYNKICFINDDLDFDIVKHGDKWVFARNTNEECTSFFYFAHNRFQFVHDFQNLYFAIVGEELSFSTEP